MAACNYPTENSSQENPPSEFAVQATLDALSEEKDEQAAADTPTPIPATDTATPPTDTPAPEIIPASQESITVDGFQFKIVRIAYDKAIAGMVPNTMGANEKIIFIEFNLLTGQNEAFANLEAVIVLESGSK